jgi:small-conductance mechanosensitive channel
MSYTFLGNDAGQWSMALCIMLAALVLLKVANKWVLRHLGTLASRTQTYLDNVAVSVLSSTPPILIWAAALYAASQALTLTARGALFISTAVIVASLVQLALWADRAVKEWLTHYRAAHQGQDPASTTSTAALGFVTRAALWLIIALMILDNFGVNITTLVASLGIGGIAVALALQNILGDLFSSLSIVLDKPFVVGDFISVDGVAGTVEYVGLKTTRVRSLDGEQVVFSNSDMLKTRIHNYKRMQTRRIVFTIGVTYQTSAEQLQAVPSLIRAIVEKQQHAQFDRAHFKTFSDSSLDFEVVYVVSSADYLTYMDIQQAINLDLFASFSREAIEFAYPTRTVHHLGAAPVRIASTQTCGTCRP